VRVLCPECKKKITLTKNDLAGNRIKKEDFGVSFFRATGCPECGNVGYSGRTAIGEILELTDEVKEMILDKKPTSEIKKLAMTQGMTPIRRNGLEKVREGVTSFDELNRVTVKEWV
jgi:type IV pilus assembly protein PilB